MIVNLFRGDTWIRAWIAAQDNFFAGASARLHVRDSARALVMSASTDDGRLTIAPNNKRIDMVMPKEVTNVSPGTYDFDLEVTWADGVRLTFDSSSLVVSGDHTYA